MPKDAREREILDTISGIRDHLLLLKRDRTKYIRSQDVMLVYDQVIEQVKHLNEIRQGGETKGENRRTLATPPSNPAHPGTDISLVDKVLESCFQLLSLFFMTIGRTNEAPAAYALTSTIKRLLSHLTESGNFSGKDLDSMSNTLGTLDSVLHNANSQHSPYLVELLAKRVDLCKEQLAALRERLCKLDESLRVVHEKLISILRSMSLANTKAKFSTSEVQKLQAQLKEIDASRVNGQFVGADGNILEGSEKVADLLNRVLKWSDIVLERYVLLFFPMHSALTFAHRKGEIPEVFRPTYDKLVGIRNDLEKLSITQAWSLRETDLYDYQRELDKIDESRVDGNFLDEDGKPAELYVQRTLLYLIRRSYGYIYYLMISSEPVSEALLPYYNQLQTLKRCLVEVKNNGGVSSVRDLYPYSMKVSSSCVEA